MKAWLTHIAATALILSVGVAQAQDGPKTTMGPVIPSFGPVVAPPPDSYNLDPDTHYKASIDIGKSAEFPGELNPQLVSVARFLNMSAQYGIPSENIEFAIVVHGEGANDLLTDEAYEKRFYEANPNTELLKELNAAGVMIYLCSQTSGFRGMAADEFSPTVTMALSAMSTHVRLQQEGYSLIPF